MLTVSEINFLPRGERPTIITIIYSAEQALFSYCVVLIAVII